MLKNNIRKLLIYLFIANTFLTKNIVLINAQPLMPSNLASSQYLRSNNCYWVYKTINGKKYKRLFNSEKKCWVTDWILVG